jgi:hypothetical protein
MAATRVYLEQGKSSVFAAVIEWPGWCRRAQSADQAIEALDEYRDRYRAIVRRDLGRGPFEVVATLGGNATTDFGAPAVAGTFDDEPLSTRELRRQLELLGRHWEYLDRVITAAPALLRTGPRGGGRDRDAVASHVREAERAYGSKVGVRVPPRTAWPEQRALLVGALRGDVEERAWPVPYAIRRLAWHISDHAWEIEDRSTSID